MLARVHYLKLKNMHSISVLPSYKFNTEHGSRSPPVKLNGGNHHAESYRPHYNRIRENTTISGFYEVHKQVPYFP